MAWRGKHGPRTASSTTTSTHAWKKLRRHVLERDHHRCQVNGPNCTRHATQVDHIINIGSGGQALDPANCHAICKQCHLKKIEQERRAARTYLSNKRTTEHHPGLL